MTKYDCHIVKVSKMQVKNPSLYEIMKIEFMSVRIQILYMNYNGSNLHGLKWVKKTKPWMSIRLFQLKLKELKWLCNTLILRETVHDNSEVD